MKPIEKQLDELWRQLIRMLNGKDKKDNRVEAHHIMGRQHHNTRWDLKNGYILSKINHASLKHHSEEIELFFRMKLGNKEYESLKAKSRLVKKWELWELEEMRDKFKKMIKELEQ